MRSLTILAFLLTPHMLCDDALALHGHLTPQHAETKDHRGRVSPEAWLEGSFQAHGSSVDNAVFSNDVHDQTPVTRTSFARQPTSQVASQHSSETAPSWIDLFGHRWQRLTHAEKSDFSDGLFSNLVSGEAEHRNTGFLDFNYYWDTRAFNVLTVNALVQLPHDLEYFQFVNYTSRSGDADRAEDWTGFFTELHLRRPIAKDNELLKHLDWTVMWADGSVEPNVGRFGIRWRFQDTPGDFGDFVQNTLKLRYTLNLHVIETDGSGWQIEHFFRRSFFDDLVYVAGFADHNINTPAGNSDWVTETQVGVKLCGKFYAVAEYRYNSFAPSQYRSGWGLGIEYVVPFR